MCAPMMVGPPGGLSTRRRRVHEPQPQELVTGLEVGRAGAVHEQFVAEGPRVPPLRRLAAAFGAEAGVLHDHRHVVHPVLGRQPEGALGVVVQQEQPGEPARHVRLGLAVRMRVVPERRGRLVDEPLGRPGGAGRHHLVRAAVHRRGQVHAVPMHRGRLVERVAHLDAHPFAAIRDERRAEVAAVEPPGVARHAGLELGGAGLRGELENPGAVGGHVRFGERRDRERAVEVHPPDRGYGARRHNAATGEGERHETAGRQRGEP